MFLFVRKNVMESLHVSKNSLTHWFNINISQTNMLKYITHCFHVILGYFQGFPYLRMLLEIILAFYLCFYAKLFISLT